VIISTRLVELVIDTVVCLTLAKWETVSGQFGGYLTQLRAPLGAASIEISLFETAPAHAANWYRRYAAQGQGPRIRLTLILCLLEPAALQRALLRQAMVRRIGGCGNRFSQKMLLESVFVQKMLLGSLCCLKNVACGPRAIGIF
jgi:hypothetical protein